MRGNMGIQGKHSRPRARKVQRSWGGNKLGSTHPPRYQMPDFALCVHFSGNSPQLLTYFERNPGPQVI